MLKGSTVRHGRPLRRHSTRPGYILREGQVISTRTLVTQAPFNTIAKGIISFWLQMECLPRTVTQSLQTEAEAFLLLETETATRGNPSEPQMTPTILRKDRII